MTVKTFFLLRAAFALLAVLVATALAVTQDVNMNVHKEYNFAALTREPKIRADPPSVIIDLYDVVVRLPDIVRVYFDEELYDGETLIVTANTNKCEYTLHYDVAEVQFSKCLGNSTFAQRRNEIEIEVRISTPNGVENTFFSPVVYIQKEKVPWPVENEVGVWPPREPNLAGNIMENYQSFSGAPSAYWHNGMDIRSKLVSNVAGKVHTPVDGKVVKWVNYGSGDLYWSLMIEDSDGFIWQYHHLDVDSVKLRAGDIVSAGDVVGDTAFWPSTWNGEYYHHIHMNIVRPHPDWTSIPLPYIDGWKYYETFDFLDNGDYNSTVVPASNGVIYFLENEGTVAFAASSDVNTPVVSGDVDMVIQMESEYTPPNDVPGQPYPNGLHRISYEVTPVEVKEIRELHQGYLPRITLIRMDKLPNEWSYCLPDYGVAEGEVLLRDIYAQSFTYKGQTHRSVFNYNERTLYYTVTNSFRGEPDGENGFWDTDEILPSGAPRFPNGEYLVTIYASDWYGNELKISHNVIVDN